MTRRATHYGWRYPACGANPSRITEDLSLVTCKSCLRDARREEREERQLAAHLSVPLADPRAMRLAKKRLT